MIDFNDPDIKGRIEQLDPTYAEFATGKFAREFASVFGKKSNFSDLQIEVLSNAIYLYLLMFFNKDELRNFIIAECEVTHQISDTFINLLLLSIPEKILRLQTEGYLLLNPSPVDSATAESLDQENPSVQSTSQADLLKNKGSF